MLSIDHVGFTYYYYTRWYCLQLGCGAGLPGLFAFVHGAEVHFQDYVSIHREVSLLIKNKESTLHLPGDIPVLFVIFGYVQVRY